MCTAPCGAGTAAGTVRPEAAGRGSECFDDHDGLIVVLKPVPCE